MTKTRWIIFAVICALVLVGVMALSSSESTDVSNINAAEVITDQPVSDHVKGDKDSKVVFIEYGDYQCPVCGRIHAPLESALAPYVEQDKIAFVFRDFPITSIHPNALAAASAAEAAGLQASYWEMYDLLYQNQRQWSSAAADERQDLFDSYAKQLGLNVEQFRQAMSSQKVAQNISFDQALANKVGANSTPTFVLNGQNLDPTLNRKIINGDFTELRRLLDQAIKDSGGTPPKTDK